MRVAVWALILAVMPGAALACRLALLLAVDVSSSIDDREYALQRDGLAAALVAPEVTRAFLAAPRPVALAAYEWSGQQNQRMISDWRLIAGAADLRAVAGQIAATQRAGRMFPTSLGAALGYGATVMRGAPDCVRRTIDVSGDGRNNDGFPPPAAYRHFPFEGVTVNGLAIGGAEELSGLVRYFGREVIRGPGAFVEVADDHADFERAMRRKLEREVGVMAIGQVAR